MDDNVNLIETRSYTLPSEGISTSVFYDPKTHSDWNSAIGDDLEKERPQIELNIYQIQKEAENTEDLRDRVISYWIDMYCEILNGQMSREATKFLVNTVHRDKELRELFIQKAINGIADARKIRWKKGHKEELADLYQSLKDLENYETPDELKVE